MRGIAMVLAALAWLVAAHDVRAGDDIYFIDQQTTVAGGPAGGVDLQLLVAMGLQSEGRGGQRLRVRQLWSRVSGGGHSQDTLTLDPAYPDEEALIRVLRSGFEASLDRNGRVRDFGPVDPEGWKALVEHNPRASTLMETMRQATGMTPHALPRTLRVGQRWSVREDVPGFGQVQWERTVVQLEQDQVLVDVHAHGPTLELRGRQALLRADGMPIEAWLELSAPETAEAPATRSRIYLVNLQYLQGLDLDWDPSYDTIVEEHMQRPPFSGSAADAEPHLALDTLAEGELLPWMSSIADIDAIDRSLVFRFDEDSGTPRPLLRIGGQLSRPVAYGEWARAVETRLQGVALLDRDGRELPGLEVLPVRRFPGAVVGGQLDLTERQVHFPFRLPPGTPAAALESLDRIRLDVDVTVYEWAGSETVTAGTATSADGRLAIDWSGRRATVSGDMAGAQGIWTVAIALGADGAPIPYQDVMLQPFVPGTEPGPGSRRLAWERTRRPGRIELAAAQPIAALQLRQYRWGPVRRQWEFRNIGTMGEGGPLVGVHHLAPRPARPAGAHGAEVLAALRIEPQPYAYAAVLLDGPLVPWARAYCQASYGGKRFGESHLLGSGTDPYGEPDAAAPPRMGWEFVPSRGEEPPEALVATLECPAATQQHHEPVQASRCFHPEGDGWLRIDDSCRSLIDMDTVDAFDAEGLPLGTLPAGARDNAMRFWGEPAEVNYILRSERLLQRELRLSQPAR